MAETPILKVSELTYQIKNLLEDEFPFVWVEGELSNVTLHSSGHCYFTLKDEKSQIRGVMFRANVRYLRFKPENGTTVIIRGRLSVYEPRGEYQIVTNAMEPLGKGSLQLAFEQTKKKLESEGLFDPARKRPLPVLPQRICIITSPTGAAIRDILRVMSQRYANLSIDIIPVLVQGLEAPQEIRTALEAVSALPEYDVVIVGRGGGSIEDLWAFNDEGVARAIAACPIPVVSAVGHEIDFTIADFIADVRAPTPSAAAEMVVDKKDALMESISLLQHRLKQGLKHTLRGYQNTLELARRSLPDPRKKLEDLQLRNDDLIERARQLTIQGLQKRHEGLVHLKENLCYRSPLEQVVHARSQLENQGQSLLLWAQWKLERCAKALEKAMAQLDATSPLNILKRGYSITRTWPEKKVVIDAKTLDLQQVLNVKLHQGELICRVEEVWEKSETS
jgi:exodeoxyribonuclease VII large subunit